MADLTYIESGYLTPDSGYFTYTANANAAISSSASMSATAGVIKSADSAMVVSSTVAATISHIEGADLFAFTEATLAIEVSRLRDSNLAATSAFTVATDASRILVLSAEEDAIFTVSATSERSRATSMDAQAAFSISASGDVLVSPTDVSATLTASFTVSSSADKTTEGQASISASSVVSTDANRIAGIDSSLSTACSLSATISHIEGADLTALGDSTLTADVVVSKEFSSNLSSTLAQSVNETVYRGVESTLTVSATETASLDKTASVDAALTINSSISVELMSIVELASSLVSSSSIQVSEQRIRGYQSDESAVATLSATISHIHGADLVGFANATLSAESNIIFGGVGNLASTVSQIAIGNYKTNGYASVTSYAYLNSRAEVGNLLFKPSGQAAISTAQKKFGAGSLYLTSTTPASYIYADDNVIWDQAGTNSASDGNWHEFRVWIYPTSSQVAHIMGQPNNFALYQNGTQVQIKSLISGTWTSTYSGGTLNLNQWNYIQWVRSPRAIQPGIGSSTYFLYLNGTALVSNSTTNARVGTNTSSTVQFRIGYNGVNDTVKFAGYIDDAIYIQTTDAVNGGYVAPTSGYFTVPTSSDVTWPKYADRIFQLSFNSQFNDTGPLTLSGQANLSSTTNLTSILNGPVRLEADLSATASLSCSANRVGEIELVAFTDAALTTTASKILQLDSAETAAFTQTVNEDWLRLAQATLDSAFEVDAKGKVRKEFASAYELAVFTEISAAQRLAGLESDFASEFNQAVTAVKITEMTANIAASAAISADVSVIKENQALFTSISTLTSTASMIRSARGSFTVTALEDINYNRYRGYSSAVSSNFTLEAFTSGIAEAIVLEVSEFTVSATILKIQSSGADLSSTFTQTASATKAIEAASSLTSQFSESVAEQRIRGLVIQTEAVFSELTAAAMIGSFFINCEVTVTETAVVNAVYSQQSSLASTTTMTTVANEQSGLTADLTATAVMDVDGTTNITGEADLVGEFTVYADVDEVSKLTANLTAEFTLGCTATRNRGFASLEMSAGTMSVTAARIRNAVIQTEAIFSEMTIGSKAILAEASLNSQFTLTVNTAVLHLDENLWKISAEDWQYTIGAESRFYKIGSESRLYKITN